MIETKFKAKVDLEKAWRKISEGINMNVGDTRLNYGDKVRIKRRDIEFSS